MNCKPGDLAITVRALHEENIGCIVLCVRLSRLHSWAQSEPVWLVEGRGPGCFAPDSWLRPLRGNEGEDQTLQWAPVPGQKVEVPA